MGRRFLSKGLSVGLLSDDPAENEETAVSAEPAADSVETELLAVADASDEVEENQAQTEEAADVAEGLEAFAVEMKAAMENGGISRAHAATITRLATESLVNIGEDFGTASRVMPALESFGSTSRAMESTSIGMESLGEKAKEIWKKILAQLEKAWNFIRGHFLKLFGAFEKLKKRAAALAAKVEANTEGKEKEKTLEREDVSKAIQISGKVDAGNIEPLVTVAKAVGGQWTSTIGELGEKIGNFFSEMAGASTKEEIDKAAAELGQVKIEPPKFGGASADPTAHGYEKRDGLDFFITAELPGGKAIYAYIDAHRGNTSSSGPAVPVLGNIVGQVITVGSYKAKEAAKAPSKIPTLPKADITKICAQVDDICDEMINYKRNANKFNSIEKKISDSAKKLGNRSPKSDEPAEVTAALKEAAKLAVKAPGWLSGTTGKFYTEAATAVKGFLDWGELSLAQYKAD